MEKIIPSAIVIILLALLCVWVITFIKKKKLENFKKLKSLPINLPEGFTYTAHTGCVGTRDNSLEAIETGAQYGADIVEFDLNFTKEGKPVLSHDKPKGGEVTLDEAFKKISEFEKLKVNVDLKSCVNLETIIPLAEKHNIKDRIFFTGVTLSDVETVKKACPDIDYYLNYSVAKPEKQTDEYLQSIADKVRNCGAVGINFNKDNATKRLVDKFHENGLLVSIWTVNNEKGMYKILHLSPDNITTRNPDIMNRILKK